MLAVAVIHYEETTNNIFDWSVYIDSVNGKNHEQEKYKVALEGDKPGKDLACFLFPELDKDLYRY